MVDGLARQGALDGHRLGIIDDQQPGNSETVTAGAVATLERLGYEVTHRVDLSADGNTAISQIPVAIQEMRSRNVDRIFLLTNFLFTTTFVQQADQQGYRPEYFATDWQAQTQDISVSLVPTTFRATAITTTRVGEWRAGTPEPEVDASCRRTYVEAGGDDRQPSDGNSYQAMTTACGLLNLLTRAAAAAGPNLTRQAFTAAMQGIGPVALPNFGGASFAAGKFDAADLIRTVVYQPDCRCWLPTDGFAAPRY